MGKLQKENKRLQKQLGGFTQSPTVRMLAVDKSKVDPNLKGCAEALVTIARKPHANIFLDPVPKHIPKYYEIVKRPMWLRKVADKLEKGIYPNVRSFRQDVNQVWKNAQQYNPS